MHRDDGLLIASGADIRSGFEVLTGAASVVDLAPTILHWMGHEVPADMDGRVLQDLMSESYVEQNPVRLTEAGTGQQASSNRDYTDEEEDEIMQRLRDLGYMN